MIEYEGAAIQQCGGLSAAESPCACACIGDIWEERERFRKALQLVIDGASNVLDAWEIANKALGEFAEKDDDE